MRTYAGDTSLPGGKVELEDKTIEDTAVSSECGLVSLFLKSSDDSVEKLSKR